MKVWHRPLGSFINSILKKEISKKLKSVLLSHFFEEFNLPRELEFMQQFGITNEQLQNKIYMEEYIRQYFGIDNVYDYTKQNQRIFCRAEQLKQIVFYKPK